MTNKYLEKIASIAGLAKAWKETPGASKASIALGSGSLGVGLLNYGSSRARANSQAKQKDIEGKSLNVLQGIHKTLATNLAPTQEKQANNIVSKKKSEPWLKNNPELQDSARNLTYIGSGAAALGGAGLIHNSIHKGDLTGRETLYHGSSEMNTENIRKNGLKPQHTKGISDIAGLDRLNDNLVFAAKNKRDAKTYAYQQEGIHKGDVTDLESLAEYRRKALLGVPDKYGSNKYITKINLPTWKKENKSVWNPEVRHQLRKMKNPGMGDIIANLNNPLTERQRKENVFRQYQKTVHVQRGEGGIGTEHIVGSPNYQRNSMKEVGEFIKHNPGRFAKGLGKTLGGVAGIAGGVAGAITAHKKLTGAKD